MDESKGCLLDVFQGCVRANDSESYIEIKEVKGVVGMGWEG